MKVVFPLVLFALTVGCAHEFTGQPTEHEFASQPMKLAITAPIELAQKNYTNGLVSEAFTVLLRAYEDTHDLKCLEFATDLSDREIKLMTNQFHIKAEKLKHTKNELTNFWNKHVCFDGKIIKVETSEQIKISNDAYDVLRSDSIEIFSKEIFIPRTELVKNKMMAVQAFVSADITNPNNKESDRLIELQKRINNQRESLCKLRTEYISEVFIGPRVNLGDKLVFLAKYDKPHAGPIAQGVNSYWIEKLELLFTKDYGTWIAQSDERTRLDFKNLASGIKNALGDAKYKEFQATIELLSNNKEGGIDAWWPLESAK